LYALTPEELAYTHFVVALNASEERVLLSKTKQLNWTAEPVSLRRHPRASTKEIGKGFFQGVDRHANHKILNTLYPMSSLE
jgi:hypothetical protein